jgi:hypothetical protein
MTQQDPASNGERLSRKDFFTAYVSGNQSILNLVFHEAVKEAVAVKIYTVSGQLVQQCTLEGVDPEVNAQLFLEHTLPGYYLVHVHSGNSTMSHGIILP